MTEQDTNTFQYLLKVIDYALASYQGRFAMLTVLANSKHPFFKTEEYEKTKKLITELISASEDIYEQHLSIGEHTDLNSNVTLKKSITYLKSLQPELESLAKKVKAITVSESHLTNAEEGKLLLAALAREAYFQDNLEQSQTKLATFLKANELLPFKSSFTQSGSEKIDLVNQVVSRLDANDKTVDSSDLARLTFMARDLSALFRMHIHDIRQLAVGPKTDFSFEKAGFLQVEAQTWASYGFNAVQAGYWRAHELGIEEAYLWIQHGIVSPQIVSEWKTAGFNPAQTVEWLNVLFPPLLAIQWGNAGYHPQEASLLLQAGFSLPSDVPQDKVQEILEATYKQIQEKQAKAA